MDGLEGRTSPGSLPGSEWRPRRGACRARRETAPGSLPGSEWRPRRGACRVRSGDRAGGRRVRSGDRAGELAGFGVETVPGSSPGSEWRPRRGACQARRESTSEACQGPEGHRRQKCSPKAVERRLIMVDHDKRALARLRAPSFY